MRIKMYNRSLNDFNIYLTMYVHLYKHPLMSTRIHMYSLYLTCIEGIVRSSASASTACSCVMLSRDSDSCTRIFSLKPKALIICSLFLSLFLPTTLSFTVFVLFLPHHHLSLSLRLFLSLCCSLSLSP